MQRIIDSLHSDFEFRPERLTEQERQFFERDLIELGPFNRMNKREAKRREKQQAKDSGMKGSMGNENTHFSAGGPEKENSALKSRVMQSEEEEGIIPPSQSEEEEEKEAKQSLPKKKKKKQTPQNAFGFINSSEEESEEDLEDSQEVLLDFERPDSKEFSCPYFIEKSSLQKESVKKISCMKRDLKKSRSTTKQELKEFLISFDQS